jgi:hypothetical protein
MTPAQFLTTTPLGTRVVVRSKIEGGFTDALGYLRGRSATGCTVETRRGLATVSLDDVVAAKEVPEPPARRRPKATS